jgi:hypothetical protein
LTRPKGRVCGARTGQLNKNNLAFVKIDKKLQAKKGGIPHENG